MHFKVYIDSELLLIYVQQKWSLISSADAVV